jgi:phytoene dehydrogenase-like protein
MTEPHLVIVGGGLAGLSAGCYARRSGYRTTIIEHNLALGGVCTAWPRGSYTIDGCIHWLTGGAFDQYYEELGILPRVQRRVLEEFVTYQNARDGAVVHVRRDLDALARDLRALSEEDADEIARLVDASRALADMTPPGEPRELMSFRETIGQLWEMRHSAGALWHFRAPVATWTRERLRGPALRRVIEKIMPGDAPALFLCMVLGYLERGYLSRPVGGTARFRDALIETYQQSGGEVRLHATVDEILTDGKRATGVRLADGTFVDADAVISTSSMPETALRLLGGRHDANRVRERMASWKMFDPIVLASFGVSLPLRELPQLWLIDGIEPFAVGGTPNEQLSLRVCNDEPSLAPPGHCVIQTMLSTDYSWWATRGSRYVAEKDAAAETALAAMAPHIPGLREHVEVIDVSTPLTFWNMARSWRGAFEGWIPNRESMFGHVAKTLGDLAGFYMAGQWVEPGGGVPTAILSGRQAVQLLCSDQGHPFRPNAAR